MSATRFSKIQKVTALVPLALLSTAWTASLAGVGAATVSADGGPTLPDGTSVPGKALEDPASYSVPGTIGLGVPAGEGAAIVASASTNGIPSAALAAYQRAETVINAADKACQIPWQLIAAVGRVESDHGRYGGNTLGTDGVSRPGIYGIALDGTNNTAEITDTDAGQFDNDTVYDRAVGPMQFIPSTWSVVGVDADGDSKRNPQDIDDAALASAVYLCSGTDNLSQTPGQRKAVFRYNHSEAYVDLVLSIMRAYMEGDYTSVPNYVTSAVTFTPDYSYTKPTKGKGGKATAAGPGPATGGSTGGTVTTPPGGTDGPGGTPTTPPVNPPKDPVRTITETIEDITAPITGAVTGTVNTVTKVVATALCTTEATTKNLTTPLVNDYQAFFTACMTRYGY